jgi:TPR repeat protein
MINLFQPALGPEKKKVPQDDVETVRWFRLVAEQGHAEAQNNLGVMYGTGAGVPQDYVEAHMWRNLAAAQSSGEDRDLRVKSSDTLASGMTPAQLAEAQRHARAWDAAHQREP